MSKQLTRHRQLPHRGVRRSLGCSSDTHAIIRRLLARADQPATQTAPAPAPDAAHLERLVESADPWPPTGRPSLWEHRRVLAKGAPLRRAVDQVRHQGADATGARARQEEYEAPWESIAIAIGGLIYVLSPVDLIPDAIPSPG
jgi:hypothetical protein